MVLCDPIYIKSIPYYYEYYNNYLKKIENCESDKFIINSLKCKDKFILPKFITKNELIKNLNLLSNNVNNNSSTFIKDISTNINNNTKCSICFNTCHNRVFLSCNHSFCYKCLTEHINQQKFTTNYNMININHNIKSNNNSLCVDINQYNPKYIQHIKCPICNICVNSNNINLLIPQYFMENTLTNNLEYNKGVKGIYLKNFVKLLLYYSLGDNDYKEFLFKYIGIKTFHILNNIHFCKSPFNIEYNKKYKIYKIIISHSNKWTKYMNTILNNDNYINNTTINFINYSDFTSLVNNKFNLVNLNKSNYQEIKYDFKYKIMFFFTELENISQSNNIKTLITDIKKNIKKKVYTTNLIGITFKQIIIKNTIDEKIFKNKVIIRK